MTLINISRIESPPEDPPSDVGLDLLAAELNELARLRNQSRAAFRKRLAISHLIIVGHRPSTGSGEKAKDFLRWCDKNLRTANGKRYSSGTLRKYVRVGFESDGRPQPHEQGIDQQIRKDAASRRRDREVGGSAGEQGRIDREAQGFRPGVRRRRRGQRPDDRLGECRRRRAEPVHLRGHGPESGMKKEAP
jgi:hypothetical protein